MQSVYAIQLPNITALEVNFNVMRYIHLRLLTYLLTNTNKEGDSVFYQITLFLLYVKIVHIRANCTDRDYSFGLWTAKFR